MIRQVSENFEWLLSFPTAAEVEARQIVDKLHKDKDARFSKELRGSIELLSIFLSFQAEYRDDRDFFETRWFSLMHHPLRTVLTPFADVIERVSRPEAQATLNFEDLGSLVKALDAVRGKMPKLRNELQPSAYLDEESYLADLRQLYRRRADEVHDTRDVERLEFWRSQFVQTMHDSVNDFPMLLGLYNEWPVKTPLEGFRLERQRELRRASQGRAEYYVAPEVRGGTCTVKKKNGEREHKRIVFRAAIFWVPDVWTPGYALWRERWRHDLEAVPIYL